MEKTKFISLLKDSTFKFLFKEEEYREFYETIFKELFEIDISEYYLADNELNSGNNTIMDYRLDILLQKGDYDFISIEMNPEYKDYVTIRNLKYMYKIASNNMSKDDYKINKVKQINFNNWSCGRDNGLLCETESYDKNKISDICHNIFKLYDTENDIVIKGITLYNIYLPKYKDKCYNVGKEERYLAMFNATSYEEMEKYAGDDKVALMIINKLKQLGSDDIFNSIYDQEDDIRRSMNSERNEGRAEGLEEGVKIGEEKGHAEGLEEGREEEKLRMVEELIKNGASLELIAKTSGLSTKEIEGIKKRIK